MREIGKQFDRETLFTRMHISLRLYIHRLKYMHVDIIFLKDCFENGRVRYCVYLTRLY